MQYLTMTNIGMAALFLEGFGNLVGTLPFPVAKKIGNEIALVTAAIERLLAGFGKKEDK